MSEPVILDVPVRDLVILPAYYSIGKDFFAEPTILPDEDITEISFFDELTRHLSETEPLR